MNRALQANRGRVIEAHRARAVLMLVRIAALGAILGLLLSAATTWAITSSHTRYLAAIWLRHEIDHRLNPATLFQNQQATIVETGFAAEIKPSEEAAAVGMLRTFVFFGVPLCILFATGPTALLRRQWINSAREAEHDEVLRGTRVATSQELAALVAMTLKKGTVPIRIGGVPIPPSDETRHLLLVGRSGSGKTTALRGLVRQIAQRGEHMLVFDPDGSYVEFFYNPSRGDIILNAWDARSARWNPFDDIANIDDAYRIAAIFVPKSAACGDNEIWYDQVRAVVANIIHRMLREGRTCLNELAHTLSSATTDEIRELVAKTEASRALEPGAERASSSVVFMLTGAARIVTMLASVSDTAMPFSFDRFYSTLAEHAGPKPLIFLAAPRRYREAGAPLVTAWIDAAASAILQCSITNVAKAWLVLDEMASLPPINSLLTLFPEGRKYGAAIVIAFQSIAQLQQKYGADGLHVVTGQTCTQLIMSVGDHPTASWAVDLIGTVEVQNQRATESLENSAKGENGSLAMHRERNSLVIDSEVTGLATGEAFLRLSSFPLARVVIDQGTPMQPVASSWVPARNLIPKARTADRIEDRDDWLFAGGPS